MTLGQHTIPPSSSSLPPPTPLYHNLHLQLKKIGNVNQVPRLPHRESSSIRQGHQDQTMLQSWTAWEGFSPSRDDPLGITRPLKARCNPALSWECWMSDCQNKGQKDRHVFVGPTCHRHVGGHDGDTTQKNVGRGTTNVGPTCHLLTCWQYVGNMLAAWLAYNNC